MTRENPSTEEEGEEDCKKMKLAHAKHKLDYPMEKKRVREAAPRGAPYWGRKVERQAGVWLQWGL